MRVLLLDQITKVNYKYTYPLVNGLQNAGVHVDLVMDQKKEDENSFLANSQKSELKNGPEKTKADFQIIFQNEDFLFINKPYDIPVHGASNSLEKTVVDFYRNNFPQKKSISFTPGPVHRLDRKTTGILAFSMSLTGARWFSENIANHIYDEMIDFAKYAFNKSHAACYAVVSFQTAYLRCYYPSEFFAALMTSFMDNAGKTAEYIEVARSLGIKILPPDVNTAEVGFSVASDGAIRYGLSAVKGVGRQAAEQLLREREQHGGYRDFTDFVERVSDKGINRRAIEYFIEAGAVDCFEGNRREKIAILPTILDEKVKKNKTSMAGQMSLLDLLGEDSEEASEFKLRMPKLPEFPKEELLMYEKEAIGFYLSGHPLDDYRDVMKANVSATTQDFRLDPETGTTPLPDQRRVTIGGLITDFRTKTTKTQKQMAFLTIEDMVGTVEVLVFPKTLEENRSILDLDKKVFITGRVSVSDVEDAKLLADKIYSFSEAPRELWVQFADKKEYEEKSGNIMRILSSSPGQEDVCIYLRAEKQVKRLHGAMGVSITDELCVKLRSELGEKNVKLSWKVLKNQRN